MSGLFASWLIEMVLVSVNSLTGKEPPGAAKFARKENAGGSRLPLPSDIFATVIFWGALGLMAEYQPARTFATAIGFGMNVATLLAPYVAKPGTSGLGKLSDLSVYFPSPTTKSTTTLTTPASTNGNTPATQVA